jgi:hypothetical protein
MNSGVIYLHLTTSCPTHGIEPRSCVDHVEEEMVEGGFPHSEICGSKVVRTSPQLIAAYHVLHRLLVPRHPPNALKTLDHFHYRCQPPRQVAAMEEKKDQLARSIRAWSGQRQALKVGISHSATSPRGEPATRKPDKTDLTMTNSRQNSLQKEEIPQRQEQFLIRMT